ncbi:aminotransferase class I/II-fold pyridoxal phosphate-dependent enzyme [Nocardia sp. IBHARD005]|uniref:aminotransferase class I/II-fold pyridoxal phosphate-dependent enzyme n=1 Tax=Nocardia sp. IBHARD005 TaxID=3457765 RepID=UPI004057F62F
MYKKVRAGVDSDSSQIGQGRCLVDPSEDSLLILGQCLGEEWYRSRLVDYSGAWQEQERAVVAHALSRIWNVDVAPSNVRFTEGATEGVSLVIEFLAANGFSVALPLPSYYIFEQSRAVNGMPVAFYYNENGNTFPVADETSEHIALVSVMPNGVSGRLFHEPDINPGYLFFDTAFQIGHRSHDLPLRTLGEKLRNTDLERCVVTFTASKDLSLPGLRPGVVVSWDDRLIESIDQSRFARSYCLNPYGSLVSTSYVLAIGDYSRDPGEESAFADVDWVAAHVGTDAGQAVSSLAESMIAHFGTVMSGLASGWDVIEHSWIADECDLTKIEPHAGYSAHVPVGRTIGYENLVAACNTVGRNFRLKLNPTLMFGGSAAAWNGLYPCRAGVRVNISESPACLERTLRTAKAGLDSMSRGGKRCA